MSDDTGAGAAPHDFIGDLRTAFDRAGPPTYERLERLSERCREAAGPEGRHIRFLAHSTTHDILTGKRDNLPNWPWVISFLEALRAAAAENGLDPDAIGSTADWHSRYLAARNPGAATGPAPVAPPVPVPVPLPGQAAAGVTGPARDMEPAAEAERSDGEQPPTGDGPLPYAAPIPDVAAHDLEASGDDAVPDEERPSREPPLEATSMLRRYVDSYGRTGMRLLRHAEADDGRDQGVPAYRLATLLACENRPREALYWLQRAARVGHALARRLAAEWDPTDPWPPYYWRRGEAAFEVGMAYEADGRPHAAAVFFDRAADNGHAEAAYRAALHRMQRRQPWEAMLLFNRAAEGGFAPAQPELDGLLPRYHGDAATGAFRHDRFGR